MFQKRKTRRRKRRTPIATMASRSSVWFFSSAVCPTVVKLWFHAVRYPLSPTDLQYVIRITNWFPTHYPLLKNPLLPSDYYPLSHDSSVSTVGTKWRHGRRKIPQFFLWLSFCQSLRSVSDSRERLIHPIWSEWFCEAIGWIIHYPRRVIHYPQLHAINSPSLNQIVACLDANTFWTGSYGLEPCGICTPESLYCTIERFLPESRWFEQIPLRYVPHRARAAKNGSSGVLPVKPPETTPNHLKFN